MPYEWRCAARLWVKTGVSGHSITAMEYRRA